MRRRAKRLHSGTITVTEPDTLWATDATEAHSEEGRSAVFCIVDHATGEAWADASLRMDRFAAADILREACAGRFGSVERAVCSGRFATHEQLRLRVRAFARTYNREWLIERHGFLTPLEAREHLLHQVAVA